MSRWAKVVCGLAVVALLAEAAGVLFAPGQFPAWLGGGQTVESWMRIRNAPVTMGADPENRTEYDAFRRTQFQLLKSPVVLNAALRRPGVAELETIREQEDPFIWLSKTLEIVTNDQSEVFKLRMHGKRGDDLRVILNAVTAVYLEDIASKERADLLVRRESLAKKHQEQMAELASRRETYLALVQRAGPAGDAPPSPLGERVRVDVASLRSERAAVSSEIRSLRTDIEVAEEVGDPPDPRLAARLRILERQAGTLAAEIEAATAAPAPTPANLADLEVRRAEIEQLQRVAEQIGNQLESLDVELTAPPRVTLLEEASVTAGR